MKESLAVKYRPKTWDQVTEQSSVRTILEQQITSGNICHSLLFIGSAGCGKTTCARIYANEVNQGKGTPIELDAASNNGVDDVRSIIAQAQTKSLDSEYKVFIIDECHSLSSQGWQAFLKLIEEPPAKSIFIFCTTNPEKIPKTIISRVQQYQFKKISQKGIVSRLTEVLIRENSQDYDDPNYRDIGDILREDKAIEYIARIADGGMRDALTLLDKCLAYSHDLTLKNVVEVLGTVDYDTMMKLTDAYLDLDRKKVVEILSYISDDGKDMKQFLKSYTHFLMDVLKYMQGCGWAYLTMPNLPEYEDYLNDVASDKDNYSLCLDLMIECVRLSSNIKYSSTPKLDIEAMFLIEMGDD